MQHGALLDAELLAAVYVELTTTRQVALQLEPVTLRSFEPTALAPSNIQAIVRVRPRPLPPRVTADDRSAHRESVRALCSEAIWLDYFKSAPNEADARAA